MKKLIWLVVLFLFTLPIFVFAQDVVVETDKISYRQGEQIEITLKNNSQESMFSIAASSTPEFSIGYIERRSGTGEWDKLSVDCCQWPECDADFDGPVEIKAGQDVSFKWEPRLCQQKKYVKLEEGVYRITISWQIRRGADSEKWVWNEVKTNEFAISQ